MLVVAVWTSAASKNVKTAALVVMVSVVIVVAHLLAAVMAHRLVVMVETARVVLAAPARAVVVHVVMAHREPGPAQVVRVVVIASNVEAHAVLVIVAEMTAHSVNGWRCRETSRS